VIGSILGLFAEGLDAAAPHAQDDAPSFVVPLVDIVDGQAVLDTSQHLKQPDWSHADRDSGAWPAARLGNQPVVVGIPRIRENRNASRMNAVARSTAPADRPFPVVLSIHAELEKLLAELADANSATRRGLIRMLGERLRSHIDVTQRVLYPMVRRVAGTAGDDASWSAEHAEREGLRIVDRLVEASTKPLPDRAMRQLAEELRTHIEAEQRHVIPLLVDHLDGEQLESLADALNEVRLRTQPQPRTPRLPRRSAEPQRKEAS
jgi:hemerythrin-like domain-containing protein